MIKLYGSPQTSAGRCYWCLEEIGLAYEGVSVDLRARAHKAPEFLKLNPNGKVPVLVDQDVVLWESMAINFYLGDKYKQDLIGSLVKDRAYIRQWSYWALSELQPPLVDLLIQLKFVPEERRDMALITKSRDKALSKLQILDEALKTLPYLVANRFTLADLNTYSVVDIANHVDLDLKSFSGITSWSEKISARESFKKWQKLANPT